ncbi:hypothetical protein BDK51DRAFT_51806 [Blyttiomyces helicus]|uniref:Uncharacterized protein n=1 Tax=Blyttiomyces helicus TaxID=388810 RepID=A0A4P9W5Z6_9FUNG|nr:hypothetical protein BDK51DRAFT_51806 [Blyttiomyces helicus]|eukprot:RKO87861.1 hypothetical protein BDK51DRAFT_51806 [Blyttiomyces helicus]
MSKLHAYVPPEHPRPSHSSLQTRTSPSTPDPTPTPTATTSSLDEDEVTLATSLRVRDAVPEFLHLDEQLRETQDVPRRARALRSTLEAVTAELRGTTNAATYYRDLQERAKRADLPSLRAREQESRARAAELRARQAEVARELDGVEADLRRRRHVVGRLDALFARVFDRAAEEDFPVETGLRRELEEEVRRGRGVAIARQNVAAAGAARALLGRAEGALLQARERRVAAGGAVASPPGAAGEVAEEWVYHDSAVALATQLLSESHALLPSIPRIPPPPTTLIAQIAQNHSGSAGYLLHHIQETLTRLSSPPDDPPPHPARRGRAIELAARLRAERTRILVAATMDRDRRRSIGCAGDRGDEDDDLPPPYVPPPPEYECTRGLDIPGAGLDDDTYDDDLPLSFSPRETAGFAAGFFHSGSGPAAAAGGWFRTLGASAPPSSSELVSSNAAPFGPPPSPPSSLLLPPQIFISAARSPRPPAAQDPDDIPLCHHSRSFSPPLVASASSPPAPSMPRPSAITAPPYHPDLADSPAAPLPLTAVFADADEAESDQEDVPLSHIHSRGFHHRPEAGQTPSPLPCVPADDDEDSLRSLVLAATAAAEAVDGQRAAAAVVAGPDAMIARIGEQDAGDHLPLSRMMMHLHPGAGGGDSPVGVQPTGSGPAASGAGCSRSPRSLVPSSSDTFAPDAPFGSPPSLTSPPLPPRITATSTTPTIHHTPPLAIAVSCSSPTSIPLPHSSIPPSPNHHYHYSDVPDPSHSLATALRLAAEEDQDDVPLSHIALQYRPATSPPPHAMQTMMEPAPDDNDDDLRLLVLAAVAAGAGMTVDGRREQDSDDHIPLSPVVVQLQPGSRAGPEMGGLIGVEVGGAGVGVDDLDDEAPLVHSPCDLAELAPEVASLSARITHSPPAAAGSSSSSPTRPRTPRRRRRTRPKVPLISLVPGNPIPLLPPKLWEAESEG